MIGQETQRTFGGVSDEGLVLVVYKLHSRVGAHLLFLTEQDLHSYHQYQTKPKLQSASRPCPNLPSSTELTLAAFTMYADLRRSSVLVRQERPCTQ